uniref:Metalloendopeptidase n=1 Tax=Graphocephala atropunctata TaxID=36148 RepID=A0A1B6KE11_9HEMI
MLYLSAVVSTIVTVLAFPEGNSTAEMKELNEPISQIDDGEMEPRTFLKDSRYLWPVSNTSAGPVVFIPYQLNSLEPEVENLVLYYIGSFKNHSCIQWIPRTNEQDFVIFESAFTNGTKVNRCYTNSIGRRGGSQFIRINSMCLKLRQPLRNEKGIAHEMMHTLGFTHEQQRRDSRCYLNVSQEGESDKSIKVYRRRLTDINFPYDFESIMHYTGGRKFVSLQGKPIGATGPGPSWQDWRKINYLYCSAKHICEDKIDLCEEHKRYLKQCYQDGHLVYDKSDKFIEIEDTA